MSNRTAALPQLPPEAVVRPAAGHTFIVATIDPDGRPATTFMGWVLVKDERTLRLCVDRRSRTFQNLVERSAIAVELLADGLVWGVKGTARVVKEQLESTPFPCAAVEVAVDEARDHGAPGTLFVGPRYSYREDKQHRHALEARMYEELAGA